MLNVTVIRDVPSERTTVRYHRTPVRMVIIKKTGEQELAMMRRSFVRRACRNVRGRVGI